MATTANLSSIIRFYAEKQRSPFVDFNEFCNYLRKYAEHHVEESPDLVKYLGDPAEVVTAELEGLAKKRIAMLEVIKKKTVIVSVSYCTMFFANKYKEMLTNDTIPYPPSSDLPNDFPSDILEQKSASVYLKEILENQDLKSPALYVLNFKSGSEGKSGQEIPPILMPACVPASAIIESAKIKIRKILTKDEYHDYFMKKLRDSNPGKEMIIQTFFDNFVENKNQPTSIMETYQGDDYYYWGQLCYFIRFDFEKIQDRTIDDNNILQAIIFSEIHSVYLKQKMQQEQKREDALKELAFAMNKPPYIFSMEQIIKFKDQSGRRLYGQFSEDDLKEFIRKESAETGGKELPNLLNFKVASGTRYFVNKNNVIPVIVRLCNEAHNSIEQTLEDKWYNALLEFEKLPEMNNPKAFEDRLKREVEEKSPILWALLNSNFITLLSYEKGDGQVFDLGRIFSGNELLPYSDLLLLKSSNIYAHAKMRLPFYYLIPVLSWLFAMMSGKKKSNDKAAKKGSSKGGIEEFLEDDEEKEKNKNPNRSKKEKLADVADELTRELVPEGSSIDRELDFLCKQWNHMIGTEARINLTNDVNALIRDYMRRVVSTLNSSTFTADRVKSLAHTLVKTPNMQRIKDEGPLTEYVELYILKLVSNR